MRLLVFGGRKFNNQSLMQNHLQQFYELHGPITCIIHGCATGADSMAQGFARNWLGCNDTGDLFKADWKNIDVPGAVVKCNQYGPYNAVAGHQRNQRMIDQGKPDWGMMFPGDTGTADMKARLDRAGIPVWDATA